VFYNYIMGKRLLKYGNGGRFAKDLLATGLNVLGDFTGLGDTLNTDTSNVENTVMRKINRASNNIVEPVASAAMPAVLNVAGLSVGIPGLGSMVQAGETGLGAIMPDQKEDASTVMNIDPRYQRMSDGGVIQLPDASETDTMPVDASGNPTSVSKRPPVAMLDSGEVVWNGYVFSQDLGFAEKAKRVLNRYKLRLGDDFSGKDRISKTQMNSELADLADEQERYKEDNGLEDSSEGYATGGKIHVKEENRGKFTSAADRRGMGVQEFASHVLANKDKYSPTMVKRANFAHNAAGWKHGASGMPLKLDEDPDKNPWNMSIGDFSVLAGNSPLQPRYQGPIVPGVVPAKNSTPTKSTSQPKVVAKNSGFSMGDDGYFGDIEPTIGLLPNKGSLTNQYTGKTNIPIATNKTLVKSSLPQVPTEVDTAGFRMGPDEYALLANAATLAARGINIAANRQKDFTPTSYSPALMNLEMERDTARRDAALSRRMLMNRYRNNRAAQLAALSSVDENMATAMSRSYVNEGTYNTEAINKQRQMTASSIDKMKELREMERASTAGAIDTMIADAGASVQSYYKDKINRKLQQNMMNMASEFSQYTFIPNGDGTFSIKKKTNG